jgi:autotransporter-associated beta strand protein
MNIGGGAGPALFNAANAPVMAAVRGNGTINIEDNGTLRITGTGANASSSVLGLTVNDDRQASGALQSVGTVNLNTGGTLEAAQIRMTANRGGQAVVAIFNFNGGVWKFTSTASLVYGGSGTGNDTATVNVGAGGAVIDKNGFNGSIAMPLLHNSALGATPDGGLDISGAGTLTLTGVNTYTGDTRVREGGLTLAATGALANSANLTLDPGAILTLQSATGLGDGLALYLVDGNSINLNFTGEDIIGKLFINDVEMAHGIYGTTEILGLAPGITATGTGFLLVPEPSTATLLGLGVFALIGWRRSRR